MFLHHSFASNMVVLYGATDLNHLEKNNFLLIIIVVLLLKIEGIVVILKKKITLYARNVILKFSITMTYGYYHDNRGSYHDNRAV